MTKQVGSTGLGYSMVPHRIFKRTRTMTRYKKILQRQFYLQLG